MARANALQSVTGVRTDGYRRPTTNSTVKTNTSRNNRDYIPNTGSSTANRNTSSSNNRDFIPNTGSGTVNNNTSGFLNPNGVARPNWYDGSGRSTGVSPTYQTPTPTPTPTPTTSTPVTPAPQTTVNAGGKTEVANRLYKELSPQVSDKAALRQALNTTEGIDAMAKFSAQYNYGNPVNVTGGTTNNRGYSGGSGTAGRTSAETPWLSASAPSGNSIASTIANNVQNNAENVKTAEQARQEQAKQAEEKRQAELKAAEEERKRIAAEEDARRQAELKAEYERLRGDYNNIRATWEADQNDYLSRMEKVLADERNKKNAAAESAYRNLISTADTNYENSRNQINLDTANLQRWLNERYGGNVSGLGMTNRLRAESTRNNNLSRVLSERNEAYNSANTARQTALANATNAYASRYADLASELSSHDINADLQRYGALLSAANQRYSTDTNAGLQRYNTDSNANLQRYSLDANAAQKLYDADIEQGLTRYNADVNAELARYNADLNYKLNESKNKLDLEYKKYIAALGL